MASSDVTLVSPDGTHEVTTADPTRINQLIYGLSYKPKGGKTIEEVAPADPTVASAPASKK